jgi:hypothetical protein
VLKIVYTEDMSELTYKVQGDLRFFGTNRLPLSSSELVEIVRRDFGNRLIMSVSGKDSVAAWLYLREQGFELIPYWCYDIPGMSFDEQAYEYYQEFFQTKIYRIPHPILYNYLRRGDFQPPDVWAKLKAMHLPNYDYFVIENLIALENGLGENYLSAVGMRAADNLNRLRMIRPQGPGGLKRRRWYYPIWDWKLADVRAILRKHNCKLSRSYAYFDNTGNGVDYLTLSVLRDHLPADYRRVLELYPLAEMEVLRFEKIGKTIPQ